MKPLEKIINGADWKVLLPFYGLFQMDNNIKIGRLDPRNESVRVAMLGCYNMVPYVLVIVPTLSLGMLKAAEYIINK